MKENYLLTHLKTTAVIESKSYAMLRQARLLFDLITFNDFLSSLFREIVKKNNNGLTVSRKTVRYQQYNPDLMIFHYTIDPDIYESLVSLRCFKKISVSKMINEGIKEFFQIIFSQFIKKTNQNIRHPFIYYHKKDNYKTTYSIVSKIDLESLGCHYHVAISMEHKIKNE